MTENQLRTKQGVSFPIWPLPPTYSTTTQLSGLPHLGKYLRLCPLQSNRGQDKKNMAQMKDQIKTPKIELSNEETANLSDAEFKTLVISMLTEMVEHGHTIEEKVLCIVK